MNFQHSVPTRQKNKKKTKNCEHQHPVPKKQLKTDVQKSQEKFKISVTLTVPFVQDSSVPKK